MNDYAGAPDENDGPIAQEILKDPRERRGATLRSQIEQADTRTNLDRRATELGDAIDELESMLNLVFNDLESVLSPAEPSAEGEKDPGQDRIEQSKMAHVLQNMEEQIRNINARARDIRRRLEI